MKNLIEYYYNINVDSIKKTKDNYYVISDNDKYIFEQIDINKYDVDNLYNFNMFLLHNNNMFHRIILNKNNLVVTTNNNKNYILLKINIKNNKYININDILKIDIPVIIRDDYLEKFNYSNWIDLWIKKINYFEYYVDSINEKNTFLMELVNYYIGLAENAVTYIENILKRKKYLSNSLVVSHKRIKYKYTLEELYDPLNIIFDDRVRDISEYLKDSIIRGNNDFCWLKKNIDSCQLSEEECQLLYGRMLFPSFFFDKYECYINEKINEKEFLSIINEIQEYEKNLKDIYIIINSRYHIPGIKWLIK